MSLVQRRPLRDVRGGLDGARGGGDIHLEGIFLEGSGFVLVLLAKGEVNGIAVTINLKTSFHGPFGWIGNPEGSGTACKSAFGVTATIGPLLVADTIPFGGSSAPLTISAKQSFPSTTADESNFAHVSPEVTSRTSEPHGRGPLRSLLAIIASMGLGGQSALSGNPLGDALSGRIVLAPRRNASQRQLGRLDRQIVFLSIVYAGGSRGHAQTEHGLIHSERGLPLPTREKVEARGKSGNTKSS